MQLDAFKQAAKRLRAQIAALGRKDTPLSLDSHAQSLDLLARVLGYRDFHEARLRLEPAASAKKAAQDAAAAETPRVISLIGAPGCGKTLLSRSIIAKALVKEIPVRVLEIHGAGDYRHFAQSLGAQEFTDLQSAAFLSAWRSDAPFVYASCGSRELAAGLDFSTLALASHMLFVCDEAGNWGPNFRPLGGMTILVAQTVTQLPVASDVVLAQQSGNWALQVPSERMDALVSDIALRGLTAM